MVETGSWINCDDGAKLFLRRWVPETADGETAKPVGLVLAVHGMAEHSLRYRPLAEALCAKGFEVWAADARGHGLTADLTVNGAGKGGLLGHCADKGGFFRVVEDLRIINRHIADTTRAEYGELPFFLLGHSWGSFLSQAYIENPGKALPLAGCVLSGTRGRGGLKVTLGAPFLALIALLKGSRRISKLSIALSTGPYNKPFRPNRTGVDWLSRNEKAVDSYVQDPLCGQRCSSGFFRDMIGALAAIHSKKAIASIARDLPVYIACGSADPVGDMGASPTALVNAYRSHGIADLEFVIYPEARHEIFNETNREEVIDDLLNWLLRHV
jgi:alpha-beta hydrolase superfamily lysophospholipase